MDLLRNQWCAEPSVHGGKERESTRDRSRQDVVRQGHQTPRHLAQIHTDPVELPELGRPQPPLGRDPHRLPQRPVAHGLAPRSGICVRVSAPSACWIWRGNCPTSRYPARGVRSLGERHVPGLGSFRPARDLSLLESFLRSAGRQHSRPSTVSVRAIIQRCATGAGKVVRGVGEPRDRLGFSATTNPT